MKRGPQKSTIDTEVQRLAAIGTAPIGASSKRPRPGRSPQIEATLQRVMDRRGYQRFYYHVSETTLWHAWEHQDALNHCQMELETMYGVELVELISVWSAAGDRPVFHFYFKIGPIPWPDVPFPIREKTVMP